MHNYHQASPGRDTCVTRRATHHGRRRHVYGRDGTWAHVVGQVAEHHAVAERRAQVVRQRHVQPALDVLRTGDGGTVTERAVVVVLSGLSIETNCLKSLSESGNGCMLQVSALRHFFPLFFF